MAKHALIIDDDEIFHYLSIRLLRSLKIDIQMTTFLNGKLGLDYLQNHYKDDDYYFIFLDINMPIMNGWEFLDQMHQTTLKANNIEIYIVSSSTDSNDITKSKDYSLVNAYISKPIEKEQLVKILGH